MLRIKFDYKRITDNEGHYTSASYYFATEALDYENLYWEPRITESFEIERFFDITTETSNRIRTLSVTLDNSDKFFNQFVESDKTLLNNTMTLYYDAGDNVTKIFKGSIQSIENFSSTVTLSLREIGYEYLEENFPDAQIAYDYYSENGINESWNAIPIHFGTVNDFPISWVNSFNSEFMIGSGPILKVTKIYIDTDRTDPDDEDEIDGIDNGIVYDTHNGVGYETGYKATENSNVLHVRIFRGTGYDADGKREIVTDQYRPETVDTSVWTSAGNGQYNHISQWGGFAYIQFFTTETKTVNGQEVTYEIPAYPYNHDGSVGQVYVCLEGIVSVTKSGNTYIYGNTPVRNPASIIKMMFCNKQFVSEAPCAIGFGYNEEDCDFSQAITDCNTLGFKIDGSFNEIQQFSEALKKILYVCRGYISEDNQKITLKIDKDIQTVSAVFDEAGEIGYDCILESWNEPSLDEQINRVRISYKWNDKKQRFEKKPDPNHESPDYDASNPSGTLQYDSWLCDYDAYRRIKKWNTNTMELRFISDTLTAHKLGSYYLRKSLYQRIKGTITVANEHASGLDAGNLIKIRSNQFGWYGSNTNDGKLFQITSIKKGEENTAIEFLEYSHDIFMLDSQSSITVKTRPNAIKSISAPKKPKGVTTSQTVVEGSSGTQISSISFDIQYADNSTKTSAMIQYADMGTTQPSSMDNAIWVDGASISGNKTTIDGLTPGHWYYFRTFTVNANGSSDYTYSGPTLISGDTTPPSTPIFTLSSYLKTVTADILLNNPPSDLGGFELWRSELSDENEHGVLISNVNCDKGECSITDITVPEYNTLYYYSVRAYDTWGNVSPYSSPKQAIQCSKVGEDDMEGVVAGAVPYAIITGDEIHALFVTD